MDNFASRAGWRLGMALGCFLIIILAVGAWGAPAYRTGSLRPTEKQRAWVDAHMVKTRDVRLNSLGLGRVNAERTRRGMSRLPAGEAVPLGNEASEEATRAPGDATGVLPSVVDNSALNAFPPVGNQQSLGSCAAFSSTYYTMTYMTAMARGLDAKNGGSSVRFSPKWVYNMINGGEDQGAYLTDAISLMLTNGAATLAEMPYSDANKPLCYREWSMDPAVWRNAIGHRMNTAGVIYNVGSSGLAQLKALLADGYICNYNTDIYGWVFRPIGDDPATSADDAYVGEQSCYYVKNDNSGHSMTVVGYNDNIWTDVNGNGTVDSGEKGAFRIVNSWGTGWGDGGFTWIAYDAIKTTSGVSGGPSTGRQAGWWSEEAYWMTARASYTPSMLAKFTLNHGFRSDLRMSLGISNTSVTNPSTTWQPEGLWSSGGGYAFDGTTTPVDATFYLDFSDIAVENLNQRWYLRMQDAYSGDTATLLDYTLVDVAHGLEIPCGGLPVTADYSTRTVYLDYILSDAYLPDAQVRVAGGSYLGDNVYNTSGIGQGAAQTITPGGKATYHIYVQNDSALTDQFTLTGSAGSSGWRVQYFDAETGGQPITDQVTGGGWDTPSLAYGEGITIRVEVDGASSGVLPTTLSTVAVTATSQSQADSQDTVMARTTGINPLTAVTMTSSLESPQITKKAVLLTATRTGGTNVQYYFRAGYITTSRGVTSTSWTVLRSYSSLNTCTWTPSKTGSFTLEVWAREVGSTRSYDALYSMPFTVKSPLSSIKFTTSPSSPRAAGTVITLNTTPTGGARVEYCYRVALYGRTLVWTTLRGYSLIPICTWQPMVRGTYYIEVWAREVGSAKTYDLYKRVLYSVR